MLHKGGQAKFERKGIFKMYRRVEDQVTSSSSKVKFKKNKRITIKSRNLPALAQSKTINARIDQIMSYKSQKTQKAEKLNMFYSRNANDLQAMT